MNSRTFLIPAYSVESLRKEIDRVNRLAARHGIEGRLALLEVGEPFERKQEVVTRERGEQGLSTFFTVLCRSVRVQLPEAPLSRSGGWYLGAKADFTDAGLEVRVIDERARPVAEAVRHGSFVCEHCNTRRARNVLLVAIDSVGHTKTLGTECAKAYVARIEDDLNRIAFQEVVDIVVSEDAWAERESGRSALRAWSLARAAEVACFVNHDGYTARWTEDAYGNRSVNTTSNRERALAILSGKVESDTSAHAAEAAELVAWIAAKDPSSLHDALRTAYDCTRNDLVSERSLGSLCWAVEARARELADAAREAARKAAGAENNVAPEGRLAIEGTVLAVKEYNSDFSNGIVRKLLIEVRSPAAHAFTKVFVSEPSALSCGKGDVVKLTATFARKADDPKFAIGSRPKVAKA